MIRKTLLLALVSVAACDGAPDAMAPQIDRSAAVVTTRSEFDTPFALTVENPCVPGEIVTLSGTVHNTVTQKVNDNGNTSFDSSSEPVGVTGTGFPSGATYEVKGGADQTERSRDNGSLSFKFKNVFDVSASLKGYDFKVIETIRVRIGHNGEIISESDFEVTCK